MNRPIIFAMALSMAPLSASAEDGSASEGFDLLQEGTRLLLRGLIDEMEPAMRDFADGLSDVEPKLREFAESVGPALREFGGVIGDLNQYHAPERLPNGDIILRRKLPQHETPKPEQNPEIDL